MTLRFSFKPVVLFGLFTALIGLSVLSSLLVLRLDTIVNVDLYNFGLQFSNIWANKYWANLNLLMGSVVAAAIISFVSFVTFAVLSRRHRSSSKLLCFVLLIAALSLFLAAEFFFGQLDRVVNVDLYAFGLQADSIWLLDYWTYSRLIMETIGAAAVLAFGSSIMMLAVSKPEEFLSRENLANLASSVLVLIGSLAFAFSLFYNSSTLALIGLGLLFWGLIFMYVQRERYVKKTVLAAIVLSQLATLNQIMRQAELKGNPVYLPPIYSSDNATCKVFIPEHIDFELPTPEQTKKESSQMLEKPSGLLLIPTGAELAQLFEKIMKTSLAALKLSDLEQNLSKILVNELEMAKSFEVKVELNKIRIKIIGSVNIAPKTNRSSLAYSTLGSPLGSAIACALAKITGKPVVIEVETSTENEKNLLVEYRILQ